MKKLIFTLVIVFGLSFGLTYGAKAQDALQDPLTIAQAVDYALKNNPRVKQAMENTSGAKYATQSASADMLPKLQANYSYTGLAEDPYIAIAPMGKAQIASSRQFHWDVTLIQPLFTGFALSSKLDISKLDEKIKEHQKTKVLLEVIRGVKTAYYQVLLAKKLLMVAQNTEKSLRSHKNDAEKFYQHGVIRLNDLLRSQVALANALQNKEKAKAGVNMSLSTLNVWLDLNINHPTKVIDITKVDFKNYALEELIAKGMKQRPLLKALHLAEKNLDHAVTMAQSTYYPNVSLVASYMQDGDDIGATSNDFSNDHNAAITVQAKWTFFDFFKTSAEVKKAISAKKSFKQEIRKAEEGIKLEIKDAYLKLQVAFKNIDTAKTSLKQAQENIRITKLGYHQQATTSTEVLDAEADLTLAQTNYYQALYGYLDALACLERAVGEGAEKELE